MRQTGWLWLDPLLSILIAALIVKSAWSLVRGQAVGVARIAQAAHPDQQIQAEGFTRPNRDRRGGS